MNSATSGLIDIIEPVPPAASAAHYPLMWLIAAAALLLLMIWAVWWRRQRCQRAARKRLRQLGVQAGRVSQQDTAYALAAELARIFGLKQLQAGAPPGALPQTAHADWTYLVASIDRLRYQADASMDTQAWAHLFSIAESVVRWSGRC